jgi:hypothetical protein
LNIVNIKFSWVIMKKSVFVTVIVFVLSCVAGIANTNNLLIKGRVPDSIRHRQRKLNVPATPNTDWVIHGKVLDNSGHALSGLKVSAYDKDLRRDERLGFAVTDRNGYFNRT